jgi:UDP-N-acetyl-D-galactosamine dehydrogenase
MNATQRAPTALAAPNPHRARGRYPFVASVAYAPLPQPAAQAVATGVDAQAEHAQRSESLPGAEGRGAGQPESSSQGPQPRPRGHEFTVAVLGLGHAGLPLAVEFGKKFRTLGIDVSAEKVAACAQHTDPSGELSAEAMRAANRLQCTTACESLNEADFIVIATPTGLDGAHRPELGALKQACETVGRHLKRGAVVVFESTVYPGATREVCIPLLEAHSALSWKKDFFVAYSPSRISPGDPQRNLTQITKLVGADTPATLGVVAEMYGSIIGAGVFKVSSMEVAEAAKLIENTQRDLNIALMNELAVILHPMGIDTQEVLDAAGSKWNFVPFRPGLVGGPCVGMGPDFLVHMAQGLGERPQVISAGRRVNDGMARWVAQQTFKLLVRSPTPQPALSVHTLHPRPRVIVLGLSFKEDCADLRNTQVVGLVAELRELGCDVAVHDPMAQPEEAERAYGITLCEWAALPAQADAIVVAVAHRHYRERTLAQLLSHLRPAGVFVDVKSAFDAQALRKAGVQLWRL